MDYEHNTARSWPNVPLKLVNRVRVAVEHLPYLTKRSVDDDNHVNMNHFLGHGSFVRGLVAV